MIKDYVKPINDRGADPRVCLPKCQKSKILKSIASFLASSVSSSSSSRTDGSGLHVSSEPCCRKVAKASSAGRSSATSSNSTCIQNIQEFHLIRWKLDDKLLPVNEWIWAYDCYFVRVCSRRWSQNHTRNCQTRTEPINAEMVSNIPLMEDPGLVKETLRILRSRTMQHHAIAAAPRPLVFGGHHLLLSESLQHFHLKL